ncbi:MAG: NADH-quinone oxidoreductase subunit N [Planctomycetota bacterium]
MELFSLLLPEIVVVATALVLFLFGVGGGGVRMLVPWIALGGLLAAGVISVVRVPVDTLDFTGAVTSDQLTAFVRVLTVIVGIPLVLLSWPTNDARTGNSAVHFGLDSAEYFGLLLLSLSGIMLVSASNDTMLLFMGIELASIPTYVLVAMGRPLPSAQEAGVKYFYLGAMSAAVLLMGFAYLYGVTGTTNLAETATAIQGSTGVWLTLALILVLLGLCFKLAAFPLHFYAGDVYAGAATPVTALLSFVPKAVGVVALVKVLVTAGAGVDGVANGPLPAAVWQTLLVVAILTMTVGNTMALMTRNLKRVMAYSSIAHSGYMLVALTAMAAASLGGGMDVVQSAAAGVLFYLVAYGVMNAGVFGVLMMLPTRERVTDSDGNVYRPPATSAETYDEIRGVGRRHPILTAAMAICCISLIGIPLTVGFLGKFYVFRPVLELAGDASGEFARALWILVGATAINAAIAAGYYLKILSEMILKPAPDEAEIAAGSEATAIPGAPRQPWPLIAAVALSAGGALLLGFVPPVIDYLSDAARLAALDVSTRAVELADGTAVAATESSALP